jgi:DeoR/GlpR family transcriptional regulator of sugar metabolism
MILTLEEAKERVLVELWLQSKASLTVSNLAQCLGVNRETVERAVVELLAGRQLVDNGHGYRWALETLHASDAVPIRKGERVVKGKQAAEPPVTQLPRQA